jgi:RNA polymerase sigma-70 factor, ECF subfamily
VQSVVNQLLADLFARSSCETVGLTRESFSAVILCEVGSKHATAAISSETEVRTFFLSLRVDELALARACAAGVNSAWEIFLTRFREKLYLSALRIAREDSAARELADTLYADLYGTSTRDGQRSLQSSPPTPAADRSRAGCARSWPRNMSTATAAPETPGQPRRGSRGRRAIPRPRARPSFRLPIQRLAQATDEAIASLSGEDRMVLSAYYLDGRTLAEIARMLGVHESTISRKLDKLAKSLRKQIVAALGRRGMSRRQAEEALEVDVRDLQVDIRRSLGARFVPSQRSLRRE